MARPGKITDSQAASRLCDVAAALVRECKHLDELFDDCSAEVQADLEAVLGCDFESGVALRLLKYAEELASTQ